MSSSSSRLTVPPDNKKVCQLYFGKSPVGSEANTWKCTCGTVCKQNIKLGYTNLMSHSKQKHPNYLEMFHLAQQAHGDSKSETASVITRTGQSDESVSGQTTLEYMLDSRSTNVFKWLEWIVMGQLRLMISLRPVKRNVTRWTGVPDMFQHFERLLSNLDEADDEIMNLVPTAGQKRNNRDHKQALANFKSVTIALQRREMSLKEVSRVCL
ncbi:hypothetical protein EMCRGX_G024918 [Ephydatia muelleri]